MPQGGLSRFTFKSLRGDDDGEYGDYGDTSEYSATPKVVRREHPFPTHGAIRAFRNAADKQDKGEDPGEEEGIINPRKPARGSVIRRAVPCCFALMIVSAVLVSIITRTPVADLALEDSSLSGTNPPTTRLRRRRPTRLRRFRRSRPEPPSRKRSRCRSRWSQRP